MTSELNPPGTPVLAAGYSAGWGMGFIPSALIFLCAAVSVLHAQVPEGIRIPKGVGPLLVGFEEKVYRGEDNRILLSRGRKGQRKNLAYSIFVQPEHGQLKLHPESGIATYQTKAGLNPGVLEDRFEFRVKDAGIGDEGIFSAAVEVILRITDRMARLEVPEMINFGEVVMGGSQAREIIIANKGDAVFRATVSLPQGFQINGQDEVELNVRAGASQSLMIRFLAKKKPEKGRVLFQLQKGNPGARTALTYEVSPPFQVQDKLTLGFDDESHTRKAQLRIRNPFENNLKIRLMLPDRLHSNLVEYEIAGASTKPVMLNIPSDDAGKFAGSVKIIEKGFTKSVQVFAEACPARVVVVGMEENDAFKFEGFLDDGTKGIPDGFKRDIELRNLGGRSANVSVRVNPPFHLMGGSAPRELKPGQSFILPVELRPGKVGPVAESLNIDYAGNPLVINLEGQVLLSPGVSIEQSVPPPEWRGNKGRNESVVGGLALRELMHGRNETRRRFNSTVPPVRKIRIIQQRSDSMVISWQVPAVGDWEYIFEALVTLRDEETRFPVQTWVEIKPEHLTITKRDTEVRAEIVGIVPGGEFQFRIFTVNDQGQSSFPATLRLAVKDKAGAFGWFRVWMLPLTALLLTIIFCIVRRIRHERQLYG
jgi:hypothetical protein